MAGFFRPQKLQTVDKGANRLPRCGQCGFAKRCKTPRFPVGGTGKNGVLLVGEAPGTSEDKQKEHFVGEGGSALVTALDEIDVEFEDCWYTYAMICKPGSKGFGNQNIAACRPTLLKTIHDLKPKVIILLGGAGVRSLIPMERGGKIGSVNRWVGFNIPSLTHDAWICPTYSTKQILKTGRDPTMKMLWKEHLSRATMLWDAPRASAVTLETLKEQVEIILSPRAARARLRDLARSEGILAWDYECTGLKPEHPKQKIVSVSFCLDGRDTFAIMMDCDKVIRGVSKVLKSERLKKVASNMKFEERWTRKKLGHPVAAWDWDTMVAAHVLDNRPGITSVKFQAFIYFGVPDYDKFITPYLKTKKGKGQFNRIEELDKKDLLLYNGIDSLLEFMVMEKQKKAMGI